MLLLSGLAFITVGLLIATFDLARYSRKPNRPCVYCGKFLTAPLYECRHRLGNAAGTAEE